MTCPLHNWVISLETGEAQGADEGQVATYPARVEDGRILLDATFLRKGQPHDPDQNNLSLLRRWLRCSCGG